MGRIPRLKSIMMRAISKLVRLYDNEAIVDMAVEGDAAKIDSRAAVRMWACREYRYLRRVAMAGVGTGMALISIR